MNNRAGTKLRHLLEKSGRCVIAPGAYDALTARLVELSGFEAVYMSGAGVSYTSLGQPDIGLLSGTEMAARAAQLVATTDLPVIADADTGYGNALNVIRTVQEYERAGVAALQIEDQVMPKRCGHMAGKEIISLEEAARKIGAACFARRDPDTVIIARTDALAIGGMEEALRRAQAYEAAGADLIFVEAPRSIEQMRQIIAGLKRPAMANMVEKGQTPLLSATELAEIGYKLVIFPGALARFMAKAGLDFLARLHEDGTTRNLLDQMLGFDELNKLLGSDEIKELEQRFSS